MEKNLDGNELENSNQDVPSNPEPSDEAQEQNTAELQEPQGNLEENEDDLEAADSPDLKEEDQPTEDPAVQEETNNQELQEPPPADGNIGVDEIKEPDDNEEDDQDAKAKVDADLLEETEEDNLEEDLDVEETVETRQEEEEEETVVTKEETDGKPLDESEEEERELTPEEKLDLYEQEQIENDPYYTEDIPDGPREYTDNDPDRYDSYTDEDFRQLEEDDPGYINGDVLDYEHDYYKEGGWHRVDWGADSADVPHKETLQPGTRFSRMGSENGRYLGDTDTFFDDRQLPVVESKLDKHTYEVLKPLDVEQSTIAQQKWGPEMINPDAQQYKTSQSIKELIENGFLREVPPTGK